MAPHFSILAWKIPWTEEPGRLQSMGSLRVGSLVRLRSSGRALDNCHPVQSPRLGLNCLLHQVHTHSSAHPPSPAGSLGPPAASAVTPTSSLGGLDTLGSAQALLRPSCPSLRLSRRSGALVTSCSRPPSAGTHSLHSAG